jgi:small subunit ribosomal protein S13e
LRDSHGIAQVRFVTGNKILRILKAGGLAPEIPEDLYHLIKKVRSLSPLLEGFVDGLRRLLLCENIWREIARIRMPSSVLF